MGKPLGMGWALVGAVASCGGHVSHPPPDICGAPQGTVADEQNLAAANTAFALSFFPAAVSMAGGASANVVLSPYSVSVGLTMTSTGAASETASQMQDVLHLAGGGATEAASFAGLACADEQAGSSNGNTLVVANALWAQTGMAFESDFENALESGYRAPLQQVDFAGNPSSAAAAINAWASSETQGQIPVVVGPADVTPQTRLVLADAIYFKGTWAEQFDASRTAPQPFTLGDGSTVAVETMTGTIEAKASMGQMLTVLELPYRGGSIVLDFLMPRDPGGLAAFESGLTPSSLASTFQALGGSSADVVYVPKFSLSTRVELAQVLVGMGMADAFDSTRADFSKMDGAMDLSIGAVVQQAKIEVDEHGTVAAAATAVATCGNCGGFSEPLMVRIDQPFVFVLRDTKTQSILFLGHVTNPAT
jgi:serpin B